MWMFLKSNAVEENWHKSIFSFPLHYVSVCYKRDFMTLSNNELTRSCKIISCFSVQILCGKIKNFQLNQPNMFQQPHIKWFNIHLSMTQVELNLK